MPTVPLVDVKTLDLSGPLHDKKDLDRLLRQRGRFSIIDGILQSDLTDEQVVGYIDVRSDAWWAEDHIPGRPIFPGMLMVEASAQLGSFDFFRRRPEMDLAFIGFTRIDKTRFRSIVEPDCRLILVGKIHRVRRTMFTYRFQGFVDESLVFESEVTGMVL